MDLITGQPPLHPHACGILPFPHLATDPHARFVDTGRDFEEAAEYGRVTGRLYVSEAAIGEMARVVGHPLRHEHAAVLAERDALRAENEDLREQLRAADAELDGISHLKARGYQPVKRVGRPPIKKAA